MGARLQRFAGVIRQLFPRDSWLQRLAQEGLSLGVRPGRVSAGRPLEPHGSPEVLSAIRQEVVALWRKRAIERVPVNELDKPAVYSRLIVVPKAGGKLRPCLNLRRLNQFVPNETFKMEGMNTVQQLIRPNCWMASLDIRVAYLHVAIHRISVDLLRFVCDGQHWRCRAMIFGASVAPRIFTRLMKALIAPLRDEGIAVGQLHRRLSLTRRVGSGMPPSVLAAESVAGVIRLVDQLREIRTDSNASDQVPGIRDRLSGNDIHTAEREAHQAAAGQRRSPESPVASYEAATGELGRLDRFDTTSSADDAILSRGIVQHLRQAAHNSTPWDTTLELNEAARTDAAWWSRFQDHWNGSCIILCKPTVTIVSDASDFGWGAAIIREDSYRNPKSATTIAETHGSFRPIEIRSWHINEKELRAILLALEHFAPRLPSGSVIEIRSDNTTAVAYVMSQGGRWPHLNRVAQTIWSLAIRNRWHLQASYIQGSNNSIADYLSRLGSDRYDWSISHREFHRVLAAFDLSGKVRIDLFATERTSKCRKFVSRFPNCNAWRIDAFSFRWNPELGWMWACPPEGMVGKVLSKAIDERAKMILILPFNPRAPWWSILRRRSKQSSSNLRMIQVRNQEFSPAAGSRHNHNPYGTKPWKIWALELDGSRNCDPIFPREW